MMVLHACRRIVGNAQIAIYTELLELLRRKVSDPRAPEHETN